MDIFVINPVAGKEDSSILLTKLIERYYDSIDGEYRICTTTAPGIATEMVSKIAAEEESCRFFACGGDGTLSEVLNGLCDYKDKNHSVGAIPVGSGNDFIKYFKNKAPFLDLNSQYHGSVLETDIIRHNFGSSINICSVGFDANVAANFIKFKKLPGVNAAAAYNMAVLNSVAGKLNSEFEIEIDGEVQSGKYLLVAVANGICYGGGFNAAPNADIRDGYFDVVVVRAVSRLKLLNLISAYKEGRHIYDSRFENLVEIKRAKNVKIKSFTTFNLNSDGEVKRCNDVEFSLLHKAVSFILPRGIYKK